MSKNIKLICSPLRFYSTYDEDALFEWLAKIKCINEIQGIGRELHVKVKSSKISDIDLENILGIFQRYKFDMKQLSVFLNEGNKEWFYDNTKAFWHKKVFEKNRDSK